MENNVIQLLKSHRSNRRYTDRPIPRDVLNDVLTSAQWAPSSHNGQAYSIIIVRDKKMKGLLSEVCESQKWVITCPVFLVFCIDFYRLKLSSEMHGANFEVDEVENLLTGAVDTALAGENVLIAGRSYGLSGVMIGGIREDSEKVATLLEMPELTFPLFGMCLGYTEGDQRQKPRLPKKVVLHDETYQTGHILSGLGEYDAITADYYTRRTNGRQTDGWTKQMAEYFSEPQIPTLKSALLKQGFKLK